MNILLSEMSTMEKCEWIYILYYWIRQTQLWNSNE